jgi:hypothetical protein
VLARKGGRPPWEKVGRPHKTASKTSSFGRQFTGVHILCVNIKDKEPLFIINYCKFTWAVPRCQREGTIGHLGATSAARTADFGADFTHMYCYRVPGFSRP